MKAGWGSNRGVRTDRSKEKKGWGDGERGRETKRAEEEESQRCQSEARGDDVVWARSQRERNMVAAAEGRQ